MAALFTAFDISGLTTNVTTVLVAGVALLGIFVGFKYLKKSAKML